MKKKGNFFKQAQAWILTLAMLVSSVGSFGGLTVFAQANQTETISEGKIVANNYELTQAEEDLIVSGLLIGGTHTYLVPDSDDGLITVDSDNKKVFVSNYEGTSGYLWKPISAKIVVGNETVETVSITNGEGSYSYDGNAFSVIAEYALDLEIEEETQRLLLNAPAYLVEGLANLKAVADVKGDLAVIQEAMPHMVQLSTTGLLVKLWGQYITVEFSTEAAKTSTLTLNEQMTANDGLLDLTVMINEYEAAESKVQYLIENGAELKAKAAETQKHIENILTAAFWSLINSVDENEYAVLFLLRSSLEGSSADLKAVCDKPWSATTETFVKDGLTALQYGALDSLAALVTTTTDLTNVEIKNPLRVSTTNVQHNMSMFDVTVKVVLNLTDSTSKDVKYVEYGSKSIKVTLAEGSTEAEILAAVAETGIEAAAKAEWSSVYVDGKFTATKSELPSELKKDIEYVITYNPNLYDVTFAYGENGTVSYPYGYVVYLESHSDAEKAYDYTVNGNYYAQGTSYTVVDKTTISRKEGKSYVSSDLYQIIADNYLSDKGAAILTSGALFDNVAVNVRYPDNSNKIVKLSGSTLSAEPFVASYEGLSWKPYSYTLSNGNTYLFNGATEVGINESFDNVTVTYRLYLTNFDNDTVLDIANLAAVLDAEAKNQLQALNRISAQQANLEMLNSSMVSILGSLIENTTLNVDAAKDAMLKACFGSALTSIQNNCIGKTGNLYLYDIVTDYKNSSDGLLYYYMNNESVRNEIEKFSALMTQMLGADENLTAEEKLSALETLIRTLPSNIVSPDKVDEYVSKLTTLESTMSEVKANLSAPNAVIDLNSDKLGALTAALHQSGKTQSFTTLEDGLHLSDSTIVIVAENKVALTVTLQIEGGNNVTITSDAVFADAVMSSAIIDKLKNSVKAQLTSQGIVDSYYNTTYSEDILDALVGKKAGEIEQTAYEFFWTYKTFEVEVPGANTQTVSFKNRVISLPTSADAAYRNDYYINGVKVSGSTYTLSDAEFDKVVSGNFKVTREVVYILRESLVNYVNSLNAAIGSDDAAFALIENAAGEFSIVLKINGSQPDALATAIQGVAVGMVQGAYPYVGVDQNKFLDNGMIYLQTLVDAMLNSGFGVDTILSVVDAEGKINNMALEGQIITNKAMSAFGGKLLETTMQLGSAESDAVSVPFYVTLGSASEDFVQVRNMFDGRLKDGFTFVCDDGKVGVTLNLPEKAYEAFLAVLLVTENIDLSDINAVNGEITVSFINNMLIPLFKGDITLETFDNTMAKFGGDLSLSSYKGAETLFASIKSFYTDSTFTYDETSGTATGTIDISSFIDSMNVGVLANIIAEKDTGISISVGVALEDLGKEYEALYIDTDAKGITNKIGLTADVSSKLKEISGTSLIVLLKDIDSDLTFNTTTLFNLNGFCVDGKLNAVAKTIIIDSNINESINGTVTGEVSGNAMVVAGKYDKDVSSFVKTGFVQDESGVVSNQYYSISENAEGNLVVSLDAGLMNAEEIPDVTGLVIDIACDILFNGYSSNYLELDGNTIYNITLMDLVGLYGESNRVDTVIDEAMHMVDSTEISKFINKVLDDAMDFAAIKDAIANNAPVFEYTMVTKPWDIELVHVTDGDYITSNIISGDVANQRKLQICVVGDKENKDLLADLFDELSKTVTSDINVDISHSKDGKDIVVNAVADADVYIDWTNPNYAVMFGVILADGIGAPANADLVSAIRSYYEDGDIGALSLAFNSLKTSQAITALKNLAKDDDFSAMVAALGLDDVVTADVTELEALFDRIGKVAAYVVRRAGLVGGARTLGSFLDADGTYGASRDSIERIYSVGLFRGYGLTADITISNAVIKIKLFDENTVEIDFTELKKQIAAAEALKKDDYTADSWAKLEKALADAKAALNATTQKAVDDAAAALKAAIEALEKKPVVVNYDELKKQIAAAEALKKDDYTADSWAKLEKALADAKAALNATTQKAVDDAAAALKAAIEALEKKPLEAPKFVNGNGAAEILKSDKIAGNSVDYSKKNIILDAHNEGITVSELKAILKLYANNADKIDIVVGNGSLSDTSRVVNGTKVTATARRNGTDATDVVTYTIIILGDVNCNGRIESGDAVLISQMLVGETTLNETQLTATDMNANGRTDIGDATRIASKFVDWANYESMISKANV